MTRYLNEKYYEKDVFDVFHGDVQIPSCEVNQTHVLRFKRKTIAVVVIPGIMGSRLRRGDVTVWDPDAPIANMIRKHGKASPKERFDFFVDGNTARIPITEPHPNLDHRQYPEATSRGWNGMWSKYFDLLKAIYDWRTPLKTYIDFPVYALPYDWMLSNKVSAERLGELIGTIAADKIILVSHSMGGLLARCYLDNTEDTSRILGVIHGAQPSVGAPAAYRRQLAGFEGPGGVQSSITNWCLGTDGPKVSSIYPFCAGGLELLPSAAYGTNKEGTAWFHIQKLTEASPPTFRHLPEDDPFKEIYAKTGNDEFWGMIHQEWMFGNGLEKMKDNLANAKLLHDAIDAYNHPRTLQLFSIQDSPTICHILWRHEDVTETFRRAQLSPIMYDGGYRDSTPCSAVVPKNGQGEYNRLYWVKHLGTTKGELKREEEIDFRTPLAVVQKKLAEDATLRIYHFYLAGYRYVLPELASVPDRSQGDGTVPLRSATYLQPTLDEWKGAAGALPSYTPPGGETRNATGWSNTAEHSEFFSGAAIEATLRGIHNLALLYLQGRGTV